MLYVPLDFKSGLTKDALVDSRAYVSTITQKGLDRIKQQAPANTFKIDYPHNFQVQLANGQFQKPIATVSLKFDIGDHAFAENSGVVKNLTVSIKGLHFRRQNIVVSDTTHGLIYFPHLTMKIKNTASEASAKLQPAFFTVA